MPSIHRLKGAIADLRRGPTAVVVQPKAGQEEKEPPGRILVSIDVLELGPIELEVRLFQDVIGGRPCYGLGGVYAQ